MGFGLLIGQYKLFEYVTMAVSKTVNMLTLLQVTSKKLQSILPQHIGTVALYIL